LADIKAFQAERYLKSVPRDVVAVLLYGTDPGLVSERATLLAKAIANDPKNPGEILRIGDSDLADDPDRLAVELRTMPMFGGRNVVRLQAENRLRPELIADLISGGTLEGFLIVEAGNLKGDSKVRSLFAAAPHAAAIACSLDDGDALAGLLDQMLASHKARITPEARELLLASLGADRTLSRSEIDKLLIYVGPGQEITDADVAAIVGDAADLNVDEVVASAFAGTFDKTLHLVDRALASGEGPQTILLALQRHLIRLAQLSAALAANKPLDVAMKSLRPPAFGTARDQLAQQARGWQPANVTRALDLVQTAIAATRQTGAPDRELTERLLIDIGILVRRQQSKRR
jgi:DNA polymerase III subunit delta